MAHILLKWSTAGRQSGHKSAKQTAELWVSKSCNTNLYKLTLDVTNVLVEQNWKLPPKRRNQKR